MSCTSFCGASLSPTNISSDFHGAPLRKCDSCNALFTYPLPDSKQLSEFYENEYSKNRSYADTPAYESIMRKRARAQLAFLEKNGICVNSLSSVLDYGAGYGYTLSEFKDAGVKNLYSYELDPKCLESLKASDFTIVDNEAINRKDFIADLCIASHLFEHLPDPINTLKMLSNTCKYIFLEVPVYHPSRANMFLDQEGHLWFPCMKSFNCLINKSGLSQIAVKYAGPPHQIFWASSILEKMVKRVFLRTSSDYFYNFYGEYLWKGVWVRALLKS
jgi:hypothetical protein